VVELTDGTEMELGRVAGQSVAGVLAVRVTTDPEAAFLVLDKATVMFGQLESRAEALAASLAGLGTESRS